MPERDLPGGQLVRFATVGIGAAGLFFVLMLAFGAAGLPPAFGNVVAYVIAFIFAYGAQQRWTFGGTTAHAQALPRYLAIQLFCAGLSGVLGHLAEAKSLNSVAAAVFVTIAASATSFVLSSRWAFRGRAPSAR